MEGTSILKWTGRGRIEDLELSVRGVLRAEGARGMVRRCGSSLTVDAGDPASVAMLFQRLPGVAWTAAGHPLRTVEDVAPVSRRLALTYLKPRMTFAVAAESTSGPTALDLAGAVTSVVLGEVKGARVDEGDPEVKFRVTYGGGGGAVGVELRTGPGGTPVGSAWTDCLVSGGLHSAVVAWHVLLSGERVRLIHVKEADESLKSVARLYSELSHRVDPVGVSIAVFDGGSIESALRRRGTRGRGIPVGGFHAGARLPPTLSGKVGAPLSLLTEEEFESAASDLAVAFTSGRHRWGESISRKARRSTFGGVRTDMHGVIDGLS